MAQGQNMGLVRHLRSGVGGENSSDRGDQRGLLDASGNAGCDDYPNWGTSLRPIRSPTGGSFASQTGYIGRARVLIGELSSEFELWQPKELALGIDRSTAGRFSFLGRKSGGFVGFWGSRPTDCWDLCSTGRFPECECNLQGCARECEKSVSNEHPRATSTPQAHIPYSPLSACCYNC
jgi:hypothetical protein